MSVSIKRKTGASESGSHRRPQREVCPGRLPAALFPSLCLYALLASSLSIARQEYTLMRLAADHMHSDPILPLPLSTSLSLPPENQGKECQSVCQSPTSFSVSYSTRAAESRCTIFVWHHLLSPFFSWSLFMQHADIEKLWQIAATAQPKKRLNPSYFGVLLSLMYWVFLFFYLKCR